MKKITMLLAAIACTVPVLLSAGTESDLHAFIDAWHHAAATADEDVFFGSMAEGAIYLGTDASERWVKHEFEAWAMEYFKRDVAWAFKPRDRHIYFSADGNTAWFEEYLDTWMGVCGGSGVLTNTADGWRIAHYHLAVTVPNEKIQEFKALVENPADQEGTDESAVMQVIRRLFDGLNAGDAAVVASVFDGDASMMIITDKEGETSLTVNGISRFIDGIDSPRDARLGDYRVRVDGDMASVWNGYVFYVDGVLSHCGIDSFQLIRRTGGWRIAQLIYNKRSQDCDDE